MFCLFCHIESLHLNLWAKELMTPWIRNNMDVYLHIWQLIVETYSNIISFFSFLFIDFPDRNEWFGEQIYLFSILSCLVVNWEDENLAICVFNWT